MLTYRGLDRGGSLADQLIKLANEALKPSKQELLDILRLRLPVKSLASKLFDEEAMEDVMPDAMADILEPSLMPK